MQLFRKVQADFQAARKMNSGETLWLWHKVAFAFVPLVLLIQCFETREPDVPRFMQATVLAFLLAAHVGLLAAIGYYAGWIAKYRNVTTLAEPPDYEITAVVARVSISSLVIGGVPVGLGFVVWRLTMFVHAHLPIPGIPAAAEMPTMALHASDPMHYWILEVSFTLTMLSWALLIRWLSSRPPRWKGQPI